MNLRNGRADEKGGVGIGVGDWGPSGGREGGGNS